MSDIQKLLNITDGYLNYKGSQNATTQSQMQQYLTNQNVVLRDVVTRMWQPTTTYVAGDRIFSPNLGNGYIAEVTTGGTSGSTEPTWTSLGTSVSDGTVTWKVIKYAVTENTLTKAQMMYRQPNTAYAVGDILRHEALKPNQYLEVITAGTSSSSDLVIS
jgi:hypothetical protein